MSVELSGRAMRFCGKPAKQNFCLPLLAVKTITQILTFGSIGSWLLLKCEYTSRQPKVKFLTYAYDGVFSVL